jgi:hypothetical protein
MTDHALFEKLRYKSGMAVTLRHLPSSLATIANASVDQTWSAVRLRLAKPDETDDG